MRAPDVHACLRQFEKLDLDENGTLDRADVTLHDARRRERRRARCLARLAASTLKQEEHEEKVLTPTLMEERGVSMV